MKKPIIFIILMTYFSAAISQKNDHVWIIGANSINVFGIGYQWGNTIADFNDEPVNFRYDSLITLDMIGTCSVISNHLGQLLMYSNGMHVHNSIHQNIPGLDTISYSDYWEIFNFKGHLPDGSDWISGFPGRQWALMLPDPGSSDYYIFHPLRKISQNGQTTHMTNLLLTKVSIGVDNPQGIVLFKDSIVSSGAFQWGLNAVRHANGRDWWIIHSTEFNEAFYIYLLEPSGLKLKSQFTGTTKLNQSNSYIVGYFSPDGQHYVTSEQVGQLEKTMFLTIYNFDRCTGIMNKREFKIMDQHILYGSISYSPDGRYLYVTNGFKMLQYDMTVDSILSSEKVIATYDGSRFQYGEWDVGTDLIFSTMVPGPDGRIYCIPPGNARSIHTIEYPEEDGEAATMIQNSINLPTQNFNSLPNFPNFRTGPLDDSPCDTLGLDNIPVAKFRYEQDTTDHLRIRFTDLSYFNPDSWSWDFDDDTSFDGRKPYWHTFPKPGEYNVCLNVSNKYGSDQFCRTLRLGDPVSTSEIAPISKITLFPNPVEYELLVTLSDYVPANGKIKIFDITGRLIKSQVIYYGINNLDVSALHAGTYIFHIYDGKTKLKVGKLLKI